MSPTILPAARRPAGLTGRHVLASFVAFFGVVFLVNGSMIYSALSTNTGLVANEPYRKGLHYNERIEASERQALLDWHDAVALAPDGSLTVTLTTAGGRVVPGLVVTAVVGRPATNREDRRVVLAETEPGTYVGHAAALDAGAWLVAVEALQEKQSVEPVYRARRRLWIRP